MLEQITPLILTYDEAPNIRRTLDKLTWASRIIVVDSGSTDGTLDIIRECERVSVLQRPFSDFASQCNFGLAHVTTPWVLSLDADYELSDELISELRSLSPSGETAGYRAGFVYRIHGRPLRGSLYPPRTVLYRPQNAHYRQDGHGHRVVVEGGVLPLSGAIFHDDRKPLSRWVASQNRYALEEADYLSNTPREQLNRTDRLRLRGWLAPVLVLFYTLMVKRCAFDGWPGWYYAFQRCAAETLLALYLADRRLRQHAGIGLAGDNH